MHMLLHKVRFPAADAFESCFAAMGYALKRDAHELDAMIVERKRNQNSGFSAIQDDDDDEEAFEKREATRQEALNRARTEAAAAVMRQIVQYLSMRHENISIF